MESIDIKIITHGRPDKLHLLLASLQKQRNPSDDPVTDFTIEVIDNSSRKRLSVEFLKHLQTQFCFSYFYLGADNISLARNTALARSQAQYLAFIDDDVVASPQWLDSLRATLKKYSAQVAMGPQNIIFTAHDSARFVDPRILKTPNPPSGSTDGFVESTSNCLLDLSAIRESRLRFDPWYGNCGGEDSDFFKKLRQLSYQIVWSQEATVYETYDEHRLKTHWIALRAFRCGGTLASITSRLNHTYHYEKRKRLCLNLIQYGFSFLIKSLFPKRHRLERSHDFWIFFYDLGYLWFTWFGFVYAEYAIEKPLVLRFFYRKPRRP